MTRKTGTFLLIVFGLLLLAFGPAHSGELLPEMHPVVLVSHAVAAAYVRWLSKESGVTCRLPREAELEKGLRGTERFRFPWG